MSFKKKLEIPIFFNVYMSILNFFCTVAQWKFSHSTQKINYSVPPQAGFQALITLLLTIWINYEKAGGVAGLVRPPKESYCKDHLVVKKCHSDPEEDELVTEYQ